MPYDTLTRIIWRVLFLSEVHEYNKKISHCHCLHWKLAHAWATIQESGLIINAIKSSLGLWTAILRECGTKRWSSLKAVKLSYYRGNTLLVSMYVTVSIKLYRPVVFQGLPFQNFKNIITIMFVIAALLKTQPWATIRESWYKNYLTFASHLVLHQCMACGTHTDEWAKSVNTVVRTVSSHAFVDILMVCVHVCVWVCACVCECMCVCVCECVCVRVSITFEAIWMG